MLSFKRIVLLLTIIYHVFAFEFKDAESEYVIFGNSGTAQELTMNENNPENIPVVLLTGASSNIELTFLDGEESMFTPSIVANGSDYAIVIGKSIDYEKIQSKRFLVQVADITNTDFKNFNLKIVNLDDENPSITSSICTMKENTTINITNTNCSYTVADPDGFLSKMNFTIIPSTNKHEDEIFAFEYKTQPVDTVLTAEVYLVLQQDQVLDYESTTLYIFQLAATDSGNNPTTPSPTVQIVVEVEDIPDELPVWTSFLYTSAFDEETPQTFKVSARDGDIGINSPIKYKIEGEDGLKFVQIDEDTGDIEVAAIDRDVGYDSIAFTIIAYETDDETSQCLQEVTFIINDIDDNSPEIFIANSDNDSIVLDILENFYGTLEVEIIINDIDLGTNAMYTVSFQETVGVDYTSAFQIIPTRGYQESTFHLAVISPTMLDYEEPDWQIINFQIVATGDVNTTRFNTLPVLINLIDYNDETPTFDDSSEYSAVVPEDIDINNFVANVVAVDRDAEDEGHVSHILLGTTANRILEIDEFTGNITTKIVNAFDYERQTEVYVQIQARDLANHTATAQLTIKITDVNDEDPTMSVSSSVSIPENQINGAVLDVTISAIDEDTNPDLEFSIDWGQSYATKNLIKLTDDKFEKAKCIEVETTKEDINSNSANAILSIIEIDQDNTPDYEIFDTLYLYLQVKDNNTEIGTGIDSALIVINIENLNDNEPIFSDDSLGVNRTVSEFATSGSTVGSVIATDLDNLNELEYSIEPADEGTPDWIQIGTTTGVLTVKDNVDLDCDDPKIYYLDYTVTVTDGEYYTPLNISIFMVDQNDNKPVMSLGRIEILEDIENGTAIYTFNATDNDRDDVYSDVEYHLFVQSSSDITNRFKVSGNNLIVNLINSATLDRDHGIAEFTCRITYNDNPTNFGSIQFSDTADLLITLLDVNDQTPTITTESISARENLITGDVVVATIIAVDDDEEGDNSRISFTLNNIDKYDDSSYGNIIGTLSETLFNITTDENNESKEATLIVNENLENYHGYYMLNITTADFGVPSLSKENFVKLEITKFNFYPPSFDFPVADTTYYLQIQQTPRYQLYAYDGTPFSNIQANDQQENKYSITFTVTSDNSENDIFQINNVAFPQSTGQLQLTTDQFNVSKGNEYQLKITANNDENSSPSTGEASYTTEISITLQFYDIESDPTFETDTEMSGSFTEEEDGLKEQIITPNATYPVTDIPNLLIYYLLKSGNDTLFNVDLITGTITLKETLDYETETSYILIIQASKDKVINSNADPQSELTVNVEVININDNPPVFSSPNYYGGIMSAYLRGAKIVTASATDLDGDILTYAIVASSLQTHGDGIDQITNPFIIDASTGDITLNFVVLVNMNGYFTFEISATDKDALHTVKATVKIYIITENNRVNFRFENTLSKVQGETTAIISILDKQFNYQSNIEKIEPDTTSSGVDLANQTLVSVYFIDESINEPVDQSVILNQVTDVTVYSELRQAFLEQTLILMSFQDNVESTDNLEELLKAWLIGVSVLLGTLCLILLVIFFLKTRSLNQRINNLSTTKFGSQESGLNRQGVTAPTTNKHALEGSNPVFNNEINTEEIIDQISTASGDSDLIGVEDNPEFSYDSYENEKKDIIS